METKWTWRLVVAIAPVAWGSTYFVVRHLLPDGHPLWGATIRALPAGLLLLLLARRRPRGDWWWRSVVLGTLNVGVFFVLVYTAGQVLPTSVATIVMAFSSLAIMAVAWPILGERPHPRAVAGGAVGVLGVILMLSGGTQFLNGWGIAASVLAMLMNAVGSVLAKKWAARSGPSASASAATVLATTAWQLLAGGLMVLPAAILLEGPPPPFTPTAALGFAYLTLVATAVATLAWFLGLSKLPAAEVGVIGLLNPVTGVLLGVVVAGEPFGLAQAVGIALVGGGLVGARHRATGTPQESDGGSTPRREGRPAAASEPRAPGAKERS